MKNIGGIVKFIKDILFPVYCLSCKKVEGKYLCQECIQTLDLTGVFECPVCHKKSLQGKICEECKKNFYLENEIAIFEYKEKYLISKILYEFKYNYIEDIKNILEDFIDIFLEKNLDYFSDIDYIIPVPLHKKRFTMRGYNQAKIIADILVKKINVRVEDILIRKVNTTQQAKLKREERLKNLLDAFEIKKDCFKIIKNKNILLIDDVYTTGSTLNECAKILKFNNSGKIKSFTIARGK